MSRPRSVVIIVALASFVVACDDEAPAEAPETTAASAEAEAPPPPASSVDPCPAGHEETASRDGSIRALLRDVPTGASVLEALGDKPVRLCFGSSGHQFVMRDRLMLPVAVSEIELAPSVGRMLSEVADGPAIPPLIEEGSDCDALAEAGLTRQAELFAIEAAIRMELELPPGQYGFEEALRAAEPDARRGVARDYLARPDGEPGVPPPMRSRFMAHCNGTLGDE